MSSCNCFIAIFLSFSKTFSVIANFNILFLTPSSKSWMHIKHKIYLTIGVENPHNHIRLTQQVKMDLAIWLGFFSSFNGRSFFLRELTVSSDSLQLYTGAAGNIGYGAVCDSQWLYGVWPDSWRIYNITALELYPIVAAVVTWGFRGRIEVCVSAWITKRSYRSLTNRRRAGKRYVAWFSISCLRQSNIFLGETISR